MYEVCSGQRLPTCGQEWHDIRNGNLCSLLPGTMPCLYGIIREMMHPDPERRPSATDLLSRDALRPTQFDTNFVHGGGSTYNNVEISKSDLARKRSASF
jgi:wee1-like protein kinase